MTTTTTTDTITLMVPIIAKPSLTLRAGDAARSRSKSQNMLPTINITIANEFVEETLSVITTSSQVGHINPYLIQNHHSPMASAYTLTAHQSARSITPPSIPILRVNGQRPASSGSVSRKPSALRPGHRRVVSLPADMIRPPRPLTDGPMGYTYTPTASRFSEKLEFFLPPEYYVRHETSNMSLVVSVCGPTEKQVIVCTPGAAHAMGVKKKKDCILKGARKAWLFFRKRVY
ncbi:hypothetical protein PMIN01_03557 [Paraphaeosphaeria minitans]|uniref:Uncharacterized protein n=1 Tax=Paraphaeosphaeria minitans TaxID=565426 RepID=A0A9P6GQB7_9PLEO|nr:hypothetical protein PMIN01_03557 [Paraphaeosphaeria minitans]